MGGKLRPKKEKQYKAPTLYLFLTDDQGGHNFAHGPTRIFQKSKSDYYETPNMDFVLGVNQGAVYRRYATKTQSVSPSRNSLMFGQNGA